jgi:hypothetical protein
MAKVRDPMLATDSAFRWFTVGSILIRFRQPRWPPVRPTSVHGPHGRTAGMNSWGDGLLAACHPLAEGDWRAVLRAWEAEHHRQAAHLPRWFALEHPHPSLTAAPCVCSCTCAKVASSAS